jgi:Tol biopolymer transport system component
MNARSKFAGFLLFSILAFCLAWTASPPPLVAQDVVVSLAAPSDAPQGTVNLNVRVIGKGFKKGAVAKWLVTGSETDLGGVTVNSTAYVSATDLIANITVASDAQTAKKFDIKVTLSSGRTGKGIELFKVIYNPPDPAIAYLANGGLMVMNADGSNQTTILQPPNPKGSKQAAAVYRAHWSPDGSQLVFESSIQGDGIYVINKDGSGLRKVIALNNGASFADPVWSPAPAADGQYKIAFSDQVVPGQASQSNLFLVNLDGTGLVNLTNSTDSEFYPTWDPYATRLAAQDYPCTFNISCTPHLYESSLGVLTSGAVGITSTTDLTASGPLASSAVFAPDWAKTQDEIVLQARPLSNTNDSALWVVSLADQFNPVELTSTYAVWPSWSPDDSKIVFRGVVNNKVTISVMNSDGSAVVNLANGDQPSWRRCGPPSAVACAP